jgi:hypothetical protein
MVKSIVALVMFSLLGASVIALPGFNAEARESAALAKADRLEVHGAALSCSAQVWPDFAASCLRSTNSDVKVREVRVVTAQR